jgi:hypothetical protein
MTKKTFLSLVVLFCLSTGVFAKEVESQSGFEEKIPHFTIAATFGLFSLEGQLEFAFNEYLSISTIAYYNQMFLVFPDLGVAAKVRWYPMGGAFNMGLGLGYGALEGMISTTGKMLIAILTLGLLVGELAEPWPVAGFLIAPTLGWKIDFGKRGGIVMPIDMGINFVTGMRQSLSNDRDWEPGFDFAPWVRIGLGISF